MVWGTKLDDVLTGDAGDNRLDGLDGNDRLSGLGGDDLLVGGGGADVLDGGGGNDLASYYTSTAGVTIHLRNHTAAGGEAQGDTLTAIEDLEGSDWNDVLIGDPGDNWLYGLDGNDTLRGGAGDDLLVGGAGADILDGGAGFNAVSYVDSARGVSIDLLTGRGAYGDAQGDWLVWITDAIGSDFADTLIGNSADNNLYGGGGNDTLNGREGDDFIEGGAGADILHGGAGWNAVSYASSEAAVAVNLATHKGSKGDAQGDWVVYFSDVVGSNFNDQLTGDVYGNGLYGGAGADTLSGSAGDDYLKGGAGADTLIGGSGFDAASYVGSTSAVVVNLAAGTAAGGDAQGDKLYQITDIIGSDFADTLTGNGGGNWLSGGAGRDWLIGGTGDDILQGGVGGDALVGGTGADIFWYRAAADSGVSDLARDQIVDFSRGSDWIDLSDVDANTVANGDQAFIFIGKAAFTGVAGQLRYFGGSDALFVNGDLNGDRVADFAITITGGAASLAATDFSL